MENLYVAALLAAPGAAMLAACAPEKPPEPLRTVRTAEVRYDKAQETNRYTGTVQSNNRPTPPLPSAARSWRAKSTSVRRCAKATCWRCSTKPITARRGGGAAAAERLAHDAAAGRVGPAAQSLIGHGAVSTHRGRAHAEPGARARRRPRPPRQLRARPQPAAIHGPARIAQRRGHGGTRRSRPGRRRGAAGSRSPTPANPRSSTCRKTSWRRSRRRATRPRSTPRRTRCSRSPARARAQAAATRTYRARLKPVAPRPLPLGATATLVAQRVAGEAAVAPIPAAAITQSKGRPAVWVVRPRGPSLSEPSS